MQQGKTTIQTRLYEAIRGDRSAEGQAIQESERGGSRKKGALDRQAALLLAVQGLYVVANALSGTFLPVYLWKVSQSFLVIGWFTFAQYALGGLTFLASGKWVKAYNKMNCLRLGVVLNGVFYSAVLLLGASARPFAVPLGMLSGIASGFFWLAYNIVYFEITEPDNRDRFNGWAGLLGSGAGIVAPFISGLLITSFAGNRGYRVIFTISLILFGAGALVSFFLHKRKASGQYDWLLGWRALRDREQPWRRVAGALTAQGIREGVFLFVIGLMVYLVTRDERQLGNFSLWTSLVGLLSFWLAGARLKPSWRSGAMLLGAGMATLAVLLLLPGVGYSSLLLFGLATALFLPLYTIPMTSSVFDLIGASAQNASRREEYIVLREMGLVLGRLIGLAVYLVVVARTQSLPALTWLLLGVGAAPLVGWWLMRRQLRAAPSPGRG
ncbi:MFS transporter [Paenibacillus sp. IB182496]|uniref:MFS transporter n=1 Tax=Paenibacillus sabuli TaxID=2772509 RepID=A0A927GUK3_9BACL|nr:MFS transporter [Paenibacillus sabuli]MBD2848446.1 MFS transporter [Paenibacillus sabuli]